MIAAAVPDATDPVTFGWVVSATLTVLVVVALVAALVALGWWADVALDRIRDRRRVVTGHTPAAPRDDLEHAQPSGVDCDGSQGGQL